MYGFKLVDIIKENMSNSSFLKFGDSICLYSEEADGYLSTIGNHYPNFIVQKTGKHSMPTIPNQRNMVFQIHPKLTYNVQNTYNKILARKHKLESAPKQDTEEIFRIQTELRVQYPRKQNEVQNNENMITNNRGHTVMYGMNVQLYHVASGQYMVMSTKSALLDKTCQRLELSDQPSASRVTFQITPRFQYRQEGDRVVYMDQIVLYNLKYNLNVHFTEELQAPQPDKSVPRDYFFGKLSPKRRRNPQNLFEWYEANISQNQQKFQIVSYRQTSDPVSEEFELHGGDVVRLKHAEQNGFITVDDDSAVRNGLQEAYVRAYTVVDDDEYMTTNQLFELEQPLETLSSSGDVLSWSEEPETGHQICKVHLRHFNSGRLLQCTYFMSEDHTIKQAITLANANSSGLEQDGANIFGKKTLSKGGNLQNFVFNLQSRSMVNDTIRTLSKDSVCNIGNAGTKLFLSIQHENAQEEDEEEDTTETEHQQQQREFEKGFREEQLKLSKKGDEQVNKKKIYDQHLSSVSNEFSKIKQKDQEMLNLQQKKGAGVEPIQKTKNNYFYRQTKSISNDNVQKYSITLRTKGSMNDVFLPIKANISQLREVAYAQSAVPKIKEYLLYLRQMNNDALNLPFFISLMELLKGIIYWTLDLDFETYQDPYKCEGFPHKYRQKVMRETRLIDLLIDCLIYPFETGLYNYDDLSTQHPITRICQLVYRILKHTVKDNNINKNYVAQWIDLFFKQAMVTTENNTFYAEKTITELLHNNKELLDTQIEETTIIGLVELCLKQPKHQRFLDLLCHLCSCNGQAIVSNQDAIYETVLANQENRKGMLCKMQTIDGIHFVTILDNGQPQSQQITLPVDELQIYFKEKKDMRLYNYFESLIDMLAAICMERNYKCIQVLVDLYSLDMVIDCTLNEKIPESLRARFARLLITLHMDKDPLEKMNIPVMTRVWDEIESEVVTLPQSDNIPEKLQALKPAFEKIIMDMKGICKVYEHDLNIFLLEALKIIETMIGLGFYKSEKELIQILKYLITLLDGSLDFYSTFEPQLLEKQIQESGSLDPYQPLKKSREEHQRRYKKTIENEDMMAIKNKVIDICVQIMDIQDNKRLSLFLIEFAKFDKKITNECQKYLQLMMQVNQAGSTKKFQPQLTAMQGTVDSTCAEVNQWIMKCSKEVTLDLAQVTEQKNFIQILLDLNLYENTKLVSNAFQLLVRYFTQKNQILELAKEVQVLQDAEEIAVLEECSEALRQMKKDAEASEFWMGDEKEESLKMARSFIDRLAALTDLCVYRENRVIDLGNKKKQKKKGNRKQQNEKDFQFLNLSEFNQQWDDEDKRVLTDYDIFDEQNQRLLRNLRAQDVSLQIIKQKQLKQKENKNAYLKVVEKAYIFLIKFVKGNRENQNICLEDLDLFKDDIEYGVHALELITEIYRDSENLLKYTDIVPLIKKIAQDIDALEIEMTKKATLLSFMPIFMQYKGNFIKDNQKMILDEFTSDQRSAETKNLFKGADGYDELKIFMAEMKQQYSEFCNDDKKMAEIDVPPELSYTITYIQLIAYCAQGQNAACETRAQAEFPIEDVIENMSLAEFCYPLKQALIFYLHHVFFDIEKDVTEDFTKVVWQVIDFVIDDLIKFSEVMQRSKRAAGAGGRRMQQDTSHQDISERDVPMYENNFDNLVKTKVDVNKNFTFVTAFGIFQVSELMQKYVFEGVFPSIESFFNLRLPMTSEQEDKVQTLLKLLFMAVPYKTKPIHDVNIQNFVKSIRSIQSLQHLGGDVNLQQLGLQENEETGQKIMKNVQISQAQKLKIFMKMVRSDDGMKNQLAKEFDLLVQNIIHIQKGTRIAFKEANTIEVKDFIHSLIKSTDVTSEISVELKTQSLKIIRNVIEFENKNTTQTAIEWETDDWLPFKNQIVDAQNMLVKMQAVPLLCRIISLAEKRAFREEALNVCIALCIGGNLDAQNEFCKFIYEDPENDFCRAIAEQMTDCFEVIKKNQTKRNIKTEKIITLDAKISEMEEKVDEEDEELQKLKEQRKMLDDEIKDTEYIADELRDGEEMTLSRAIENITAILRFLQLLCENHNHDLQKILNQQTNPDGRPKNKSTNIVALFARNFESLIKIINNVTVGFSSQLLDTIIEVVQGPCKENQKTLVTNKILDSSRELVNSLLKQDNLVRLGFTSDDEDLHEELQGSIDDFISKIATMLVSLLEGETDFEIQQKMAFSLATDDLKERLLTVFGVFLHTKKLYPIEFLSEDQTPDNTSLATLSKQRENNALQNVSLNKIKSRIHKDDFAGSIKEGFEIFNLFQCLAENVPSCQHLNQKKEYTPDQWKVIEFLRQNTAMIEIQVNGKLQRVYFPIHPVCDYVSEKTSSKLMNEVDRESQQTKVKGLMEAAPDLIDEMRHVESLQKATIQITPTLMAKLKDFSNIVGLVISVAQLFFLRRINNNRESYIPEQISLMIFILGIVQGCSSGILIVFYAINKYALVTKAGWRMNIKANKGKVNIPDNDQRITVQEMSIEQTHLILMCKGPEAEEFNLNKGVRDYGNFYTKLEANLFDVYFFLQDLTFQYYVLYFGISILGFFSNELFYSFHLLDVIQRFPTLANVTKAITWNWKQLTMTFALMLIVIYIYTTVFFFYMMETAYDFGINNLDSDKVGENRCTTMLTCYMIVVDRGLLLGGGIGDYTSQVHFTDENQKYFIKFLVDLSFFLLVKIILYNILFGVIIDTFAQLRNKKNIMDNDKNNFCFICALERFIFDKETDGGFNRHILMDHNLWCYVYYIVHLQQKDPTEYTGIESYVSYMYKYQDMSWLPRQKALCLEKQEDEEEGDEQLTQLKTQIKSKCEVVESFTQRVQKLEARVLSTKKKD